MSFLSQQHIYTRLFCKNFFLSIWSFCLIKGTQKSRKSQPKPTHNPSATPDFRGQRAFLSKRWSKIIILNYTNLRRAGQKSGGWGGLEELALGFFGFLVTFFSRLACFQWCSRALRGCRQKVTKRKRILLSVKLMGMCLLFTSCAEFLSQDVSEVFLVINSPRDSLFISDETITFWWETSRKVEAYRLQLLEGNPDNPYVLIDSLMLDNRLTVNLYEGRFSWKLRAENEGSESGFQERFFVIDTTAPLPASHLYPPDGSILNRDIDSLELRFISQDREISGIRYGVKDSVLLFKTSAQNNLLIERLNLEAAGEKKDFPFRSY